MMDRRKSTRMDRELKVSMEPEPFVGATEDVGQGGMFLCTGRPLRRGERLGLSIELPSGWADAEVMVCWSRGPQGDTPGGVGVKFLQQPGELDAFRESANIPNGKVVVASEE